ncbi:N-acyl-D-amino-acid deacylase family protein [Rugosimonospora africana]|uniref:N-acyl-D-aspartate/D-glutamate deacylase n=1 Tax=Rugosimonospora africana TaxID=556532 RepID=A0A8J3R2T6_9ACTN|nr:amidohydrolase family protein [Rugosimonospora africana]GIH21393.1 N-acyl-D-aspartate/D-glutamate deacylase [Rugosimonospora africana]
MFDLVIRGGSVLDGTGGPALPADVACSGDRIVAVIERAAPAPTGAPGGSLEAALVIDATGRYVTPGFVDAHVHADAAVFDPAVQLAVLAQGVTTLILGQDGVSFAPGSPSTVEFATRYFAAVNGVHPLLPPGTAASVAELLDGYTGRIACNAAYLVPHGTVRYEVMGAAAGAPDPGQLARMLALVEGGLADGAVGLSSGLEYMPGGYATADELIRLAAPLGGRPYVTHMRGYEAHAGTGMAEATAIGRGSGAPVHVSHYHGPAEWLAGMVDEARDGGLDVTFDSYPYLRGSSTLAMVTLPSFLPTADLDATLAALREPATQARLAGLWSAELWPRITLACVEHPDWSWTEGLRLPEAADKAGLSPARLAVELLLATGLGVGCVFDQPPTATEDSVRALLRHPAHIGGSDGIYRGGHPHPRGFGAFARLLGRHVRELGDWSWPEAVVHLAAAPARRFGLADRGLVRPGHAADLVVLDPATIADRADYARPREAATGVDTVVVGGVVVLTGGALTGATPGRGLRGS